MTSWFRLDLETHPWPPNVGDDYHVLEFTEDQINIIEEIMAIAKVADLTPDQVVHAVEDVTVGIGSVVELTVESVRKVSHVVDPGTHIYERDGNDWVPVA